MDERSAWIALASVEGVGELTFALLLTEFGSAAAALAAANDGRLDAWMARRRQSKGGRRSTRRPADFAARHRRQPGQVPLAELAERGLWTLTPLDSDYPRTAA